MIHLKKFENFDGIDIVVGDVLRVHWNGDVKLAKVNKVKSKNSYIVHIQRNNVYLTKGVAITLDDIIEKAEGVDEPAIGSDWVKFKMDKISNDMTINNYPGNDGGNAAVYNIG